MAHIVTELRAFAAELTLGHAFSPFRIAPYRGLRICFETVIHDTICNWYLQTLRGAYV